MADHMGFAAGLATPRDLTDPSEEKLRAISAEAESGPPAEPALSREAINEILAGFGQSLGSVHKQMIERLTDLEKHIIDISSAQSMQQWMAERNARHAALDLAIKYMPEEKRKKDDPAVLIAIAEAFLGWLKESVQ